MRQENTYSDAKINRKSETLAACERFFCSLRAFFVAYWLSIMVMVIMVMVIKSFAFCSSLKTLQYLIVLLFFSNFA